MDFVAEGEGRERERVRGSEEGGKGGREERGERVGDGRKGMGRDRREGEGVMMPHQYTTST